MPWPARLADRCFGDTFRQDESTCRKVRLNQHAISGELHRHGRFKQGFVELLAASLEAQQHETVGLLDAILWFPTMAPPTIRLAVKYGRVEVFLFLPERLQLTLMEGLLYTMICFLDRCGHLLFYWLVANAGVDVDQLFRVVLVRLGRR